MRSKIKKGITGSYLYVRYDTDEGEKEEVTDITSYISLKEYYDVKTAEYEDVNRLIRAIYSYIKQLEMSDCAIKEIILNPELIFINTFSKEFLFIPARDIRYDIRGALLELFRFLMEKLDYDDYRVVRLVYRTHEQIIMGDYNIMTFIKS